MSFTRQPKAVKLVMSFLYGEEKVFPAALAAVDERYGPVDFLSEPLRFEFTSYYEPEMGKNLRRRLASFRTLISPEQLPEIKIWTNKLEKHYLNAARGRKVNIDPGYLAPSKLILATGKDYSHRIYLRDGIYGDLTLTVQKGIFRTLPWTYPDYGSPPLLDLLTLLRKRYLWQMKNAGVKGPSDELANRVLFSP